MTPEDKAILIDFYKKDFASEIKLSIFVILAVVITTLLTITQTIILLISMPVYGMIYLKFIFDRRRNLKEKIAALDNM